MKRAVITHPIFSCEGCKSSAFSPRVKVLLPPPPCSSPCTQNSAQPPCAGPFGEPSTTLSSSFWAPWVNKSNSSSPQAAGSPHRLTVNLTKTFVFFSSCVFQFHHDPPVLFMRFIWGSHFKVLQSSLSNFRFLNVTASLGRDSWDSYGFSSSIIPSLATILSHSFSLSL